MIEGAAIRATTATAVRRLSDQPVVAPGAVPGYGAIFNAGLLRHADRYHLFARGVRDGYRLNPEPGPRFLDYVSDILVFTSVDGISYEFVDVLARAGDDGVHCYEDPRLQRVPGTDPNLFVMTYTNLPAPASGLPWRIGAHLVRYDAGRFQVCNDSAKLLGPDGVANKDSVIFELSDGRVALVHRVHPDIQLAVFDHFEHLWSADGAYWQEHMATLDAHIIIRPSPGALGIGAGPPPVPTPDGLLFFFHERRADGAYTMNVALLDPASGRPVRVLREAVLEPELEWERTGDVDHVVFVQGAHLEADGDTVYLVYGAADRCVGAATASVRHLLDLFVG
jgi:beta-1,2-mannobiose phosphorylase / 1,2-beta-oligomannan phosphorylase